MFGNFAEAGQAAAKLEADGYGAAWSFEGPHDPFFPLVLASQTTERIELGTAIAVAFARNPMICAHIGQDLRKLFTLCIIVRRYHGGAVLQKIEGATCCHINFLVVVGLLVALRFKKLA